MPIKAENRARYPKNWATEIRPAILRRAGDRCERCYVLNRSKIQRGTGLFVGTYRDENGNVFSEEDGEHLGAASDSEYCALKTVLVVLTIAHIHDPDPANCAPGNLQALCQRCHNKLDAPMRAKNARVTRRSRLAAGDLLDHV